MQLWFQFLQLLLWAFNLKFFLIPLWILDVSFSQLDKPKNDQAVTKFCQFEMELKLKIDCFKDFKRQNQEMIFQFILFKHFFCSVTCKGKIYISNFYIVIKTFICFRNAGLLSLPIRKKIILLKFNEKFNSKVNYNL